MDRSIFLDLLYSLQRLFVGYIPAAVVGSFFGYLIGVNGAIYEIFRRIVQIPHSIPPVAWLPIMLVIFPEKESAVAVVIFVATFWTILINTAIGMRHFRRQDNNFRVAIFHIFHALKVGVWVAWFTVIAVEMLIDQKGLGSLAWNGYKSVNINYILEAIIYIGVIGFLLDQLLDLTGYMLAQIVSNGKKSD
ncbi:MULTISPECIES: nitrate transporter [unclassified Anabaena]|uniref:nitrate transporter n=1 Tax=unclassified Anabaena TaxID=2619674 RepID=UPI002B1F01FF|nr:nitrate transporter [Anabaena sp. UHCC 0399]MEA5568360.1 nitrate transporter [Anabaena sp. UHCC 0399]